MKIPKHLGLVFKDCPVYWTLIDWNELISFLIDSNIEYLTCYTRFGWEDVLPILTNLPVTVYKSDKILTNDQTDQVFNNKNKSLSISFIDYSDSKPKLAALTRQFCTLKGIISLESIQDDLKFPSLNLLLLEIDKDLNGFPPLSLGFTEICALSSLDDSVYGFMDGIKRGIQRYSQTIQRNGV